MLPCVCQNVVRTSVTYLAIGLCATFLFLPHVDAICDLLLNRRTATWNLFVNLISATKPYHARVVIITSIINVDVIIMTLVVGSVSVISLHPGWHKVAGKTVFIKALVRQVSEEAYDLQKQKKNRTTDPLLIHLLYLIFFVKFYFFPCFLNQCIRSHFPILYHDLFLESFFLLSLLYTFLKLLYISFFNSNLNFV